MALVPEGELRWRQFTLACRRARSRVLSRRMTPSIRVDRNIPFAMRDGITLRADVFRPDDHAKHPAIVIRTPYGKEPSANSDYLSPLAAAFAGYAVVIQDVRGRFASEGVFSPLGSQDGDDGYDTIEAVAAESWCDGNVGMAGASYLGAVQWRAALKAPPALKAIAPHIVTPNRLSETRRAGVHELKTGVAWSAAMAVDALGKLAAQGKDVSTSLRAVRDTLADLDKACEFLPLKAMPFLEAAGSRTTGRFGEQDLKAFESEADIFLDYSRIHIPVMQAGGWYDNFIGDMARAFVALSERAGTHAARQGQHLLVGPWTHGARLGCQVGEVNFGRQAAGSGAMCTQRHLAFFDRYLRGIESTDLVPVRYFLMGANEWRTAETWPLPGTARRRFFLHSGGRANTASGDGTLTLDEPGDEAADTFVYDPASPVRSRGGRINPDLGEPAGPLDQSAIERRADVLCYTSDELGADLEVTGSVELQLFAASSARDTDFMVRLADVDADGRAINIAEGCIRARYRTSILRPELLTPGQPYAFRIDMGVTSHLFRRGHRLRVHVTSSDFPRFDRNMNTGNPIGEDATGSPAHQTILHRVGLASYVDLPVVAPAGATRA
jgi:putative CocE/NonD family hydrolase